jgi:ubiquinone/menaquinone biosynthesis C-methylase UbiE
LYAAEPEDRKAFTARLDAFYTAFAGAYDRVVKWLPLWERWIGQALPHILGPRVLEVSFGTGYLLTQYAGRFETYGIDYNERLAGIARRNLQQAGVMAQLQRADVEALPYASGVFDSVVNTMALTGYPAAQRALSEMRRVLRAGGRLVLVDVGYPADGNRLGSAIARAWAALGDILRDTGACLQEAGFAYHEREIGAWGSVHLYVAHKGGDDEVQQPSPHG